VTERNVRHVRWNPVGEDSAWAKAWLMERSRRIADVAAGLAPERRAIDTVLSDLEQAEAERDALRKTLEANIPSRVYGSLQEEVDFLRRDVAVLQVNKHNLIDQIVALRAEVERLREQFICTADPAANRIKALEAELARWEEMIAAWKSSPPEMKSLRDSAPREEE
jgi:uncharacterized protein (DUF3084 family)